MDLNTNVTVFRGYLKNRTYFVNLSEDYDEGGMNWHGSLEGLKERLVELYGLYWTEHVEIQRWQLTEQRIDHITGDGIDYRNSF
ncbi:MAG: hypothetical protein EBT92_14330 [Planctomycetes bacterium]|nr:hypothetical protein [Planctomycetota bacterium]